MIRIDNISKSFKQNKVLKDISLLINSSEITGLIGLNGAGKTTLIRTIAGLYTPDSGNVIFDFNTTNLTRKIALLSAEQGLYRTLTVEKTIKYFGTLQNENFDIKSKKTSDLINTLGIKAVLNKKIEELSSGWRQKVLILLTFINNPKIILLDEPSNYLDFFGQKQLSELLLCHTENANYTVYASHNLHDIEKKCDRIILIHEGLILFDINKSDIHESLEEMIFKVLSGCK
jgi:ABC-2 type transport system ATP-binding protein